MSLDSQLRSEDEFFAMAYQAPAEEKHSISYLRNPYVGWGLTGFLGIPSLALAGAFVSNEEAEFLSGVAENPVTSLAFPVIGAIMFAGFRYLAGPADKEDTQ